MSLSKRHLNILALAVAISTNVSASVLTANDMDMIQKSQGIMQAAIDQGAPDWLRTYDAKQAVENDGERTHKWQPIAEQIANDGSDLVVRSIEKTYGVTGDDRKKIKTISSELRADSPLVKGEELYYFISFSESKSELKQILQAAAEVDARVILRGMRPQDKYVNQTSYAVNMLGKDIRPVPKIAIDPRLFKVFNVTEAPAMVYRKGNKYVVGKGIATSKWFIDKGREAEKNFKDLGKLSSTKPIAERDLIEEIQSRVAQIDWDAKRKAAVERYVKKLPSFYLPPAQVDNVYKIDPRITFTKDVRAKNGQLLAAKGAVVNPLDYFPGKKLSLFVFDPLSDMQKSLVKQQMKQANGEVALLVTRIDKEKGLSSFQTLSSEMGQQVYMLQQQMVKRFQLQHTPSKVMLGDGKIIITEYGTRSQYVALDENKAAQTAAATTKGN